MGNSAYFESDGTSAGAIGVSRMAYLMRRKKDLAECAEALEKKDFELLERVGHQIKGHATTYDFKDLAPVAARLEEAAAEKNVRDLHDILKKFKSTLALYYKTILD